jgi:Tat protein secretion system quality control protein TatD with DNase activity
VPDPLLLTETDNPGGLKWFTGSAGMPGEIVNVVNALAALRRTSPSAIEQTVQQNFLRLIRDDPWLTDARAALNRDG